MEKEVNAASRISPLLTEIPWKTSYRHEDGDLVELFYVPALSRAVQYDRTTGFFSATALALAARGITRLIRNHGRMRLIVGCTLDDDEVQAIQAGYDLRQKIEENLLAVPLDPPDNQARHGLEALAWMIGRQYLDVKVAVPVDHEGRPVVSRGIYHEKVGIIQDREGNRISFSGSINETQSGWIDNRESFHVHCSWESEWEKQHVMDEVNAFACLWADRASRVKTFDFPEAVRNKILEFMPPSDAFVSPESGRKEILPAVDQVEKINLLPDEKRRAVWTFIRYAPRLWNGLQVGQVTSTVKPWPHQLLTFTKMYQNWPVRLLIADEVGLGKTITAGLFIRQVWLAGKARRILLLVPKAVLQQWQNELYEKFNLNVPIYTGSKLIWRKTHGWQDSTEKKAGRQEWHQEPFVLCSSQLLRRKDRVLDLQDAEPWDLIVLDEAHHARRKSPGSPMEGGPNLLLQLMHKLKTRCQSLLLLTATPMQVHPVEVWDLLNLLGLPPRWAEDEKHFVQYFELAAGNPSHEEMKYLAGLFHNTESEFGLVTEEEAARVLPHLNGFQLKKILDALRHKSDIPLKRLDAGNRKAALKILRKFTPLRYRMARHTRELLRHYHKKGLLETPIPQREPQAIAIEMSQAERELYDRVEDYLSETYNRATPEKLSAVGFVMTIYRRRMASSLYALQQTLQKRLQKCVDFIEEADVEADETTEEMLDLEEAACVAQEGAAADEEQEIQRLLNLIAKLDTDSKAIELKNCLDRIFEEGYSSAIIFTQYTDTMEYLKDFLVQQYPARSMGCYYGKEGLHRTQGGNWSSCSKEKIKLALKKNEIEILICTDAAGEGLNLQYCGVLINYDLPWNPMKVEQRIGRIDRIGQRYPQIRIFNFAYKDTIEAEVYFTLDQRINLFQGIVGKLQPILSRLPRDFQRLTFQPRHQREAEKQRLTAEIEARIREAEQAAFDIDESFEEFEKMPELPQPAYTLKQVDEVLNRADLRPPAVNWKSLDPFSYSVQIPGMSYPIRATTDADIFDDHCENHEFLSPEGRLFSSILDGYVTLEDISEDPAGHFWLIEPEKSGEWEFLGVVNGKIQRITTLQDLLEILEQQSPAIPLDTSIWGNAKVHKIF
ncbi:MAG: DEAD/DEAH box helicase [bacterium]